MAIKLFNKGSRTIDGHFLPQQLKAFTPDAAEKLLKLYKGEVVCLEDEVALFDASAPAAETAHKAEAAESIDEGNEKENLDDNEEVPAKSAKRPYNKKSGK